MIRKKGISETICIFENWHHWQHYGFLPCISRLCFILILAFTEASELLFKFTVYHRINITCATERNPWQMILDDIIKVFLKAVGNVSLLQYMVT